MQKELLEYLTSFITEQRLALFNRIIEQRTNYLTVVLEDIYQPQNASAVLRTCDCFGIQNVHIIENQNNFQVDTEVAMGSSKWLTLNTYSKKENNSLDAIRALKKQGYRIVATSPHINEQKLPDFDISAGKTALVFGSELPGISDIIKNEADEFLKIPMYGFTESFNISVSAAVILYELTDKMRKVDHLAWQLTEDEKTALKIQWIKKSVKSSAMIEERFWKENKKQ
ncbi:MAG: RNA methyltransferase [Draconibacterium sp.]